MNDNLYSLKPYQMMKQKSKTPKASAKPSNFLKKQHKKYFLIHVYWICSIY